MIKLGNKNIVGVSKGDTHFKKVYKGSGVIWEKLDENIEYCISGKFHDRSNKLDWWIKPYNNSNKLDITEYVNPDTKEFSYDNVEDVDIVGLFDGNDYLEKIYNLQVKGNQTSFDKIFYKCTRLTDVNCKGWKTDQVDSLGYLFSNCSSLQILDLSGLNVEKVQNIGSMFSDCSSLQSLNLSGWKPKNLLFVDSTFSGCSELQSLDLSNWGVENVEEMARVFVNCSKLENLNITGWKPNKLTHIGWLFYNCSALERIDLSGWNVGNVKTWTKLFSGCSSLQSLNLSGWDFTNCSSLSDGFENCTSLTTVIGPVQNIKCEVDLSDCPLTVDSAMVFIDGAESGAHISFSYNTYHLLSGQQLAIARGKDVSVDYKLK